MKKKVIIIGAGGHARVVADIVLSSNDELVGYLDDQCPCMFLDQNVIGKIRDIEEFSHDFFFIIGIGSNQIREKISHEYAVNWYTAIHPSAIVSPSASIGLGTVIMPTAVVNSKAVIGNHVIINTAAVIEHDNKLEDFCHISPGVHLGGTVSIGERTHIGIGACVINNTTICDDVVIGAGATVIHSIDRPGTYVGVPARIVRENYEK